MSAITPMTLVLLPGMDGTGALFAPLLRALPDQVRPLVVSYPTDRPLDYPGHLELVLAALPTDRPFVLLGESFSGPLALLAAVRQPVGLCGVILCATFVRWPLPFPPVLARLVVALGVFRLKSTRLFLRLVLGGRANAELRALFRAALARLTPAVLAARARAVIGVDCRTALRDCPVPILALVADHDRIIAKRNPEEMQRLRPDLAIAQFTTPHLILQFGPDAAVSQICRFMAAVRPHQPGR